MAEDFEFDAAGTPEFRSSVTNLAPTPIGAPVLTDESSLTKLSVRAQVGAALFDVDFARTMRRGGVLVAAIRPDEWLLLGDPSEIASLIASTEFVSFVSQVDITHSRVCLRLSGARSAAVLEKVCSLDFNDLMFPDGACGSASLAKVSSDLIRSDTNNEPSYLLLADRSFGQYLYDAIHDATLEFAQHRT